MQCQGIMLSEFLCHGKDNKKTQTVKSNGFRRSWATLLRHHHNAASRSQARLKIFMVYGPRDRGAGPQLCLTVSPTYLENGP